MSVVPPFDYTRDRYDMDNFWGRLMHRYRLIDPRLLFNGEATLRQLQATLKLAEQKKKTGKTDAELWSMKFAVESSVHPTTNDVIPPVFRMAAYVPVNIPIVVAMTLPAVVANPVLTASIHFINQSYNSAVNYANRSGDAQSGGAIAKAYVAATSASLAGGLGATYALKRVGGTGAKATIVRATLPFCAVVASGCANVSIMRWAEWQTEGVPVTDDEGNVRGKSIAAGRKGMYMCWISRFAWNVPPMMLPPLLTFPLARMPQFRPYVPQLEIGVCLAGICLGVPMALSAFKPTATMDTAAMEPEFQGLKDSKGNLVTKLHFYKGI